MILVKPRIVHDFGRVVAALFLVLTPFLAGAQVGPAMRGPMTIHIFSTYTYGSSDGGTHNNYGYSLGGFVQTTHLFGAEVRGTYLRWGSGESRFETLAGPRVAFHFARFSPYGAVLAGAGHPITLTKGPKSHLESGTGVEWKLLGGVDYYARHHFSFRIGEISFAEYYAPRTLSAIDFSGGIVYHIPVSER